MTIIEHSITQYARIKDDLTDRKDPYFNAYITCCIAVDRKWLAVLSANSHRILRFILGRTLSFKKRGEVIYKAHFLRGIPGVCCPIGMSETTFDKAVRELNETGLIDIHSFKDGNVEGTARIYEVKIAKIIGKGEYLTPSEKVKMLTNFDEKIPKNTPRRIRGTPPVESGGLNKRYINKGNTNVFPSEADAPTIRLIKRTRAKAKTDTPERGKGKNEIDFKNGLRSGLATFAQQQAEKRRGRAADANNPATATWSKKSLQSLLDTARAAVKDKGYATERVIVKDTGRRKLQMQMVDREITDAVGFFKWAFMQWHSISSSQNASMRRMQAMDPSTRNGRRPMHKAPNFDDLYQKFSYIVQIYLNERFDVEFNALARKHEAAVAAEKQAARDEVSKARRARAAIEDKRRDEERKRREAEDAERLRYVREHAAELSDDFIDLTLTYEEVIARQAAKERAQRK